MKGMVFRDEGRQWKHKGKAVFCSPVRALRDGELRDRHLPAHPVRFVRRARTWVHPEHRAVRVLEASGRVPVVEVAGEVGRNRDLRTARQRQCS